MIYLISYPRSGNTAARYLIEMLTGKPTNGLCGKPNAKDRLQQPLIHSGTDYVVHKRHDFANVFPEDTVIFILRDPIEAVIRHNKAPRGITLNKMRGYIDSWFKLLQDYDSHRGDKMLIYYDQLVQIADRASRDIYPNPQSADPDHHKRSVGPGIVSACKLWIRENYKELADKYL